VRLLTFPEYDTDTPHVMIDTVLGRLLPARRHVVDMIRPIRGLTVVEERASAIPPGRLVGIPVPVAVSHLTYRLRERRHRRAVERALALFESERVDAVLVRNDVIAARTAARFAASRRVPFVFQMSSPEAEFRINGPANRFALRRLPHIARGHAILRARRRICHRADAVLAISSAMRRYLIERDRLDPDRVFAFPMGAGSNANPTDEEVAAARTALALRWRWTIAYTGVIDAHRQPDFMLDVLEAVRRTLPDTGLLVITYQQDARRDAFEATARRRGLPVRVVGPLHHSKVAAYLRCADVMICPVPPRLEFAMMSPTKTLEALATGVPVVGSIEVEEHRQLLGEAGGGVTAPFDADAFARAVDGLLRDPVERARRGAAGRAWVRRHREYGLLASYLERILEAVVSRRSLREVPHTPEDMPESSAVSA